MIREDQDINPDNPDQSTQVFLPSDRREFYHDRPGDTAAHDAAQSAFEQRQQARLRLGGYTKSTQHGLLEFHWKGCTCSYCGTNGYDKGMKLGWNIPKRWYSRTSWFVHRTDDADGSTYRRYTMLSIWRGLWS